MKIASIGIAYEPTSTVIYEEFNANIERASKIFHFILTRLVPMGTILPLSLLSMVNYFIFDLADESFVLPFPLL